MSEAVLVGVPAVELRPAIKVELAPAASPEAQALAHDPGLVSPQAPKDVLSQGVLS